MVRGQRTARSESVDVVKPQHIVYICGRPKDRTWFGAHLIVLDPFTKLAQRLSLNVAAVADIGNSPR